MASSDEAATKSIVPAQTESDQGLREPLNSKHGSAQVPAALARKLTIGRLPAFHLPPEGLGGKKLAAVWVA